MGTKKDKLIKEKKEIGYCVGDTVYVNSLINNKNKIAVVITRIDNDNTVTVKNEHGEEYNVKSNEISLDFSKIGADPFVENSWKRNIDFTLMPLASMMSCVNVDMRSHPERETPTIVNGIEVKELNFNPYAIINGKKIYYQRPFCWDLNDKQKLIESIYEDNVCGTIVLRERSWNTIEELTSNGDKEVAFWDVVDGKQRLDALISFIHDEFKDLHGNFYSDLSDFAQRKFRNSSVFSFARLHENVTDEETIKIFLHINTSGKQMSEEHLNKIKKLTSIS